jgi:hypothetical protein
MSGIKPIETVYKGYRFRSRLEARFAVFFDHLGINWDYEKEGYILPDGASYLPDFWLPDQDCFIEIKGTSPTREESDKCRLLALSTGKSSYLFHTNIWIPSVDDAYDEYYDEEEIYPKGTKLKGALEYDPSCVSLTIDNPSSPCSRMICDHDKHGEECPNHAEIYPYGSDEDALDGTLHLTAKQEHLIRIIYIADILNSPGDSCKMRLDRYGRLEYLVPSYAQDGKRQKFIGYRPIPLPAVIREHKLALEQLLSLRPRSWEWGIAGAAGILFSMDESVWRKCPVCGKYWITYSPGIQRFPCSKQHKMEDDNLSQRGSDAKNDPSLIAASIAARQARFEHEERWFR